MYRPDELHGLNAMMPAFATENAGDYHATDTVDVDRLRVAVNRMIDDGVDVISTTGSFGEFHTLLEDEFQTLVRATLDVVNKRVPVFVGITTMNGRETFRKARFVREAGGEGIFTGVPFYYPPTVDNTIRFYRDIADEFPDLSIQIYHNPPLHRIHIPVSAFPQISEKRNIVSMKDSHRSPLEFHKLQKIIEGKISVFVNQTMCYPYADFGARGFWSTDAWMGPWPLFRLRDTMDSGDVAAAKEVLDEITGNNVGDHDGLAPQDNARKLGYTAAGYCDLGPNRSPFLEISDRSMDAVIKRAGRWKALCDKYEPIVRASRKVPAAV